MTQDQEGQEHQQMKSVKLVADALEEDRLATCKELSRATGARSSRKNAQKPTSVARSWAIHSP